jgi:hypothetical protein
MTEAETAIVAITPATATATATTPIECPFCYLPYEECDCLRQARALAEWEASKPVGEEEEKALRKALVPPPAIWLGIVNSILAEVAAGVLAVILWVWLHGGAGR